MKKVALIGAGNVNWHLAHALPKRKYEIFQVYSRTTKSAQALAKSLGCKSTTRIDKISKEADIVLIAVSDDALVDIVKELAYLASEDRLFLHTSGSTPLLILEKHFKNCGVLWPPQSIRKENKISIKNTPFVVVTNEQSNERVLEFAGHVSKYVHTMTEHQKSNLHFAAVLANNFTTHLLSLAYQQCEENNIDFQLLKPIIKETTDRICASDPGLLQTGPAIRGDQKTINRHLKLLDHNKELKKLYTLLTKSINPKIK